MLRGEAIKKGVVSQVVQLFWGFDFHLLHTSFKPDLVFQILLLLMFMPNSCEPWWFPIQFGMEVSFTTWLHNHQNDLISLIFAWVPPFPNMSKVIQSPLISVPFRSFPFPFMPPKRKVSPKKQGVLSVLLLKPVIENVFKSIFKSTGSPEGSWQEPSKKMDKGVVN